MTDQYETREAHGPTTKEATAKRLEGYGHRELQRIAAKLKTHGVEVKEISHDAIATAIANMDAEAAETAAEDPELVAALGQLKLQEIEAEFGGGS